MKKPMIICAAASLIVPLAYGEVIYENDFSTRTSVGVLPTTNWYEMPYHVGQLARYYDDDYGSSRWIGPSTPYDASDKIQDGWALAKIGGSNLYMAEPFVEINSAEQVPEGDATNPFMTIYGAPYNRFSMATHPLFNAFSNGVLRISMDMRAPTESGRFESVRLTPLCRTDMNSLHWGNTSYSTPAGFGVQWVGGYGGAIPFLLFGDGTTTGGGDGDYISGNILGRNWCRFVAEIDLDAKTVSCSASNLGLGNPTFNTVGTPVGSSTGKRFYRPVTSESGPITGLGFEFWNTLADYGAVNDAVSVDNISVAWKAPGTDTFQSCYENDFAVRRYRTLTPPGTVTGSYEGSAVAYDTFKSYIQDKQIVPNSNTSLQNIVPQPLGIDNWRRINDQGTGSAHVIGSGDSNFGNVLRLTANEIFVCVSQPLGQNITSGKVRMSADVRLPDQWHWSVARSAMVDMGAESFASTLYDDFSNNRVGSVGVGGSTSNSDFRPRYDTSAGTQYGSVDCTPSNWYRLVRTADIDAQTYDYTIYHIVDGVAESTPVFSVSGQTFRNEVRSIGAFALLGYAPGTTTDTAILFDNVQIWKGADTAQETLVYSNDFSTRQRLVDVARADVAPVIDRIDSGVDGWVRRNNGTAGAFVQAAANPALAIVDPGSHAYVFHPFGKTVTSGTLRFRVDVRPPARWQWGVYQGAGVILGDDVFLQGNRNGSDSFITHVCVEFGMESEAKKADACGLYVGAVPWFRSGNANQTGEALDTTHWYRFCVSAPLDAETYSVKLYDMGTTHPGVTTPNGTLVREFANLAYRNGSPVKGISGFALSGFGAPGYSAWDAEDPDALLFDNIKVKVVPGMRIILR